MRHFSYFAKPIRNVYPAGEAGLKEVYDHLKSDEPKEATVKLRELESEKEVKDHKSSNFDYVTFGGIFEKRGDDYLKEKSGLLCLDIDEVEDIEAARENIIQNPNYEPALVFVSPSGNGLKAVYQYDIELGDHSSVYQALASQIENETGLKVDKAPKAISSACFLPHDPNAYYDSEADQLQIKIEEAKEEGEYSSSDSSKDAAKIERCVQYLEEHEINIAHGYDDWINLGFALASLGEDGRTLYHRVSKISSKYNYDECEEQFTTCLKSSREKVTLGTFYGFCQSHDVPLGEILQQFNSLTIRPDRDFWDSDNKQKHAKRMKHLLESTDHPLVKKVDEKVGIPHDVLCDYRVGLDQFETETGSIEDALFVPYNEGTTAYFFNEDDELIADHLSRSEYLDTYFGQSKVIGQKKAIIAENPFDAMFLSCRDDFDVISNVDTVGNKIRKKQQAFLQEQSNFWKKVYVLKRAVTGKERKDALKFVRTYADALPVDCEVYWINLAEQVGIDTQYVCEAAIRESEKTIFDSASYIWNTHTQRHRFWYTKDGRKPKLDINERQLSNVLAKTGYKKTYIGNSNEPTLIKAKDSVIDEKSTNLLFDHVQYDILPGLSKYVDAKSTKNSEKLMSKNQLIDKFYSYREKMINPKFVSILNREQLDFTRDGIKHSYLYFKNTAVKVTQSDIIEIPYGRLPGYIWENQILDRDYTHKGQVSGKSEFEQFLDNVAGEGAQKQKAFRTTLGYLLHTYKDKANAKAVILTDQHTNPNRADGGTGKSIFAESIKHIRNQKYIAGKNVKIGDKFAFMDVELGDQNLFFDDVRPDFDFEGLFNVITNDMQVEAKYSNRVTIPFEDSPKIVISTNNVIDGEGHSFQRRQRVLEFSNHYFKGKNPKKEFGHRLYDDWNANEWQRFDEFMISCLQEYLRDGLTSYETTSYQKRKVIQKTSPAFIKWAEDNIEPNQEYSTNVLFEGLDKQQNSTIPPQKKPTNSSGEEFDCFLDFNDSELDRSQIKSFNKWIRSYSRYKGWELKSRKTNGYDTIQFKN